MPSLYKSQKRSLQWDQVFFFQSQSWNGPVLCSLIAIYCDVVSFYWKRCSRLQTLSNDWATDIVLKDCLPSLWHIVMSFKCVVIEPGIPVRWKVDGRSTPVMWHVRSTICQVRCGTCRWHHSVQTWISRPSRLQGEKEIAKIDLI